MYFDETSKTGFTVHNHAIVVLLPPHRDLVSPNHLLLSQHWKTPVKVHNQRGTSGGSRSNGCLKCLHDFPSHLQSSPVSFILFSSQWKGQSPTHWSLDVDGGSRWGPSDRHMPSGVIIATCPVNTVVTFQLNKFQTLISPTVSLSTYLIQSENSWYQWWRTEPDTGVNLTDQTNNAFQVIKIKEDNYDITCQNGATRKSTWKQHKQNNKSSPFSMCLTHESLECQTDICTGWGSLGKHFQHACVYLFDANRNQTCLTDRAQSFQSPFKCLIFYILLLVN